jgi:hypothetical protein
MNICKILSVLFILCTFFSCDKYDLVRTNSLDPKSKKYELAAYEAKYSGSTPDINGQILTSEWSNSNMYDITLARRDGVDTKQATLYLLTDNTWLYVGVRTTNTSGWDVYLQLRFDGNNDHIINGRSTEPRTDIDIQYPSLGGWSGYIRYDYLESATTPYSVTAPTGTQSASYGSTNVNYEFKIKLSDLNTSSGKIIGFYIFNLVGPNPDYGYEFPVRLSSTDPSKWEHIRIH